MQCIQKRKFLFSAGNVLRTDINKINNQNLLVSAGMNITHISTIIALNVYSTSDL